MKDIPGFYYDEERDRYFPKSHRSDTKIARKKIDLLQPQTRCFNYLRSRRRPGCGVGSFYDSRIEGEVAVMSSASFHPIKGGNIPDVFCTQAGDSVILSKISNHHFEQTLFLGKGPSSKGIRVFDGIIENVKYSQDAKYIALCHHPFQGSRIEFMTQSLLSIGVVLPGWCVYNHLIDSALDVILVGDNIEYFKDGNISFYKSKACKDRVVEICQLDRNSSALMDGCILTGHLSGTVADLDCRTFQQTHKFKAGDHGRVTQIQALSQHTVLVGRISGELQLWDLRRTSTYLASLVPAETDMVLGGDVLGQFCLSPDVKYAVVRQPHNMLNVYALEQTMPRPCLSFHLSNYSSPFENAWRNPFNIPAQSMSSYFKSQTESVRKRSEKMMSIEGSIAGAIRSAYASGMGWVFGILASDGLLCNTLDFSQLY